RGEVRGGQVDAGERALGHHLADDTTLVVGEPRGHLRRAEHHRRAGLVRRADRDPVQAAVLAVVADLQAEGVTVAGPRRLRSVGREHAGVDGEVHDGQVSVAATRGASRFLTGLVTCLTTHGATPGIPFAASRRYAPGETPTSSVKRVLNVPSEAQPTAKHTSVT